MSKNLLINVCDSNNADNYAWSMLFFRIDRRSDTQPYTFYKMRFKNDDYLLSYAKSLMNSVKKYQISPIETVQEYDGNNTKVSCDKISLNNELIAQEWSLFSDALVKPSDEKIKNKINGYILYGTDRRDENNTISFIKMANPFTNLTNKSKVFFTTTADDELDLFSDDVCRLYLNTDILITGTTLYTYNYNFERLFDIEKTMSKIKKEAIQRITDTNVFSDADQFTAYASQYTSNRTFVTLKQERIDRIKNNKNRKAVAGILKLELDKAGKIIIDSKEKAALLIKYLCYKIFKDGETNDVLEASSISTLTIE